MRDVNLKQARDLAYEARQLKRQGIDPLEARRDKRLAAAVRKAKTLTFKACVEGHLKAHRSKWQSARHAKQWLTSLEQYVYPSFGDLAVDAVDDQWVQRVLKPIWDDKPETASRVRGRIENVLDWAKTMGYRSGDNPARWKGHLAYVFPSRGQLRQVEHTVAWWPSRGRGAGGVASR